MRSVDSRQQLHQQHNFLENDATYPWAGKVVSGFVEGWSNGQKYAQGGVDHTVTHILCDKKNIMSLVQSTAKMQVQGFVNYVFVVYLASEFQIRAR